MNTERKNVAYDGSSSNSSVNQSGSSNGDNAKLRHAEKELLKRVRQTQASIRRIDLLTAVFAFITLALALLLFGIILDCWILSNGLSDQGRVNYAIIWGVVSFLFFIYKLIPVFRKKISPLYAVKALEEAWQDKHNLTINWWQLCQLNAKSSEKISDIRKGVLNGVANQAIENAVRQSVEIKIDCGNAIRWGVAFTIVVALVAIYTVASPKSPFAGATRIVAPFADVERPQALQFRSIEPGNTVVYQGDYLDVVADIPGAESSSDVQLLYSSEDGRLVDLSVPMESLGLSKYQVSLPPEKAGFSENLFYRIVVNRGSRSESVSDEYKIEVRPQPSFRVEKTTLTFPEYTGMAPQSFENQGDVRALEGTIVTIKARGNYELQRAVLLPDGKQTRARVMTIDSNNPQIASIELPLKWAEDSQQSLDSEMNREQDFTFYQLLSHDKDGQENRDQQNYNVSITRDLPPTVWWESAPNGEVEVPLNEVLHLKFAAEDQDFSLRSAKIEFAFRELNQGNARINKNPPRPLQVSLQSKEPQKDYTNGPTPFVGVNHLSCEITPENLGLNVGDEIEYWVVVYDSKLPNPNSGASEKRIFRVTEAVSEPSGINTPDEEEKKEEDQVQEENNESGSEQGSTGKQDNAQNSENNENQGNETEEPNEKSDEQESSDGEQNDAQEESSSNSGESSENSSEDGTGEKSENLDDQNDQNGAEEGENASGTDEEQGENQSSEGNNASSNQRSRQESNQTSNDQQSNEGSDGDASNQSESSQNEGGESEGTAETPTDDSSSNAESSTSRTDSGQSASSNNSDVASSEAFETILDFINETGANESESGIDDRTEEEEKDSNKTQGAGLGQKSSVALNEHKQDMATESQEEVDPNFNSDADIAPTKEKRDLPTRTSAEKPKEDSPSYQAQNPERIDPNTNRKEGEVDPSTNNYLGQNAPDGASTTKSDPNANITLDPWDQTSPTAADGIDSNAAEARGDYSSIPDGPFEVDQEAPKQSNRSANNNQSVDPNDLSDNLFGGGGASNEEGTGGSKESDSEKLDRESRANGSKPQSDKQGNSPTSGNSDQNNAQRGGGGGGSGKDEPEEKPEMVEQHLAPTDSPKLQYAEQASNLVLRYLEESLKNEVDPRLLKKLGWTEEQLKEFLERWKKMRETAETGNASEKQDYLKALDELDFGNLGTYDPNEDFPTRESSQNYPKSNERKSASEVTRHKTPDRLMERVRAFTQGVSQGNTR